MEATHAASTLAEWSLLQGILDCGQCVKIDGESLSIPAVIAVCRFGAWPFITSDPQVLEAVNESVSFLESELAKGRTVYGVNTGYGGSAETRTNNHEALQLALLQHLNVGILLPQDKKGLDGVSGNSALAEQVGSHALSVDVVRAMMLIRCNTLMRGHSGVRISLIQDVLSLLSKGMTPVVPLRGSISASGDLSTLSYIGGLLEGSPDVHVRIRDKDSVSYVTADKALAQADIRPSKLRAKEGLGLVNGTAASCAAACKAMYDAQHLAILTQLLTAMGTEALLGTAHNYHAFISVARPHVGQAEAAANILAFLSESKLAPDLPPEKVGLAQDRYALRTAPQWIGPQLENLMLAHRQISTEINSTTDNPLVDVAGRAIHHGGNFQAVAVTSAMEKTLSAMQMLGKLLHAQSSELIDHKTNKGLPPNLSADDPCSSFTAKGLDVNMAAYMSELSYLNRPVSSFVNSTEMGNQSVNSLGLIASRYAMQGNEVLSLMAATYLYVLCQALDLRCLHLEFVKAAKPDLQAAFSGFRRQIADPKVFESFCDQSIDRLFESWLEQSQLDLEPRSALTVDRVVGPMFQSLSACADASTGAAWDLVEFRDKVAAILRSTYERARTAFFMQPTTPTYLSTASALTYRFVRVDLKVPMHRGLVDHPTLLMHSADAKNRSYQTIGSMVGIVYEALRDGRLHGCVMEALRAVGRTEVSAVDEPATETGGQSWSSPALTVYSDAETELDQKGVVEQPKTNEADAVLGVPIAA